MLFRASNGRALFTAGFNDKTTVSNIVEFPLGELSGDCQPLSGLQPWWSQQVSTAALSMMRPDDWRADALCFILHLFDSRPLNEVYFKSDDFERCQVFSLFCFLACFFN